MKIKTIRILTTLLLTFYCCIQITLMCRYSTNQDEVANLCSGLSYWKHKRFDLYPVTPPLYKALAAIPLTLLYQPDKLRLLCNEAISH